MWWHLARVYLQLMYGAWRVSGLPQPIVTIFGGSRVLQDNPYAHQANKLAHMLVANDISVITGGGPGIMEAANCGASPKEIKIKKDGKIRSIGIGVKGVEGPNPCVHEYFSLDYFFARKYLMTRSAAGFVIFPGGFGTLDEFAEVLTLMQTKKMEPMPVILIDTDYWGPFMKWVNDEALQHGLLTKEHVALITLTDDLDRAVSLLCQHCKLK